jgi:phosphoribosylamine--glycine ligase
MSTGMKVLVVGSGGREHALSLRLLQSHSVGEVVVCPGNAGTSGAPVAGKTLRTASGNPEELLAKEHFDLVVVGPEVPLVDGLADRVRALGFPCFGPSKAAARLEGSKAVMKDFCKRHGIRAARDVIVRRLEDLEAALSVFPEPPVVKADGLCAGKGVVVAESFDEARAAAQAMLTGAAFGEAGTTVVLEERLLGAEASIHAICDGKRALLLPAAQDHKRIFEGDQGPNTGGMGTYAPTPLVDAKMFERIGAEVMQRVVDGMAADGTPFIGALFGGLMISPSGEPVVLEFNVRFGDPETQVLMPLIDGDFGEALLQAAEGRLSEGVLSSSGRHALCVVLAAENYPGAPALGDEILGLVEAACGADVEVYHAGTKLTGGKIVTAGGRVLGVSARGSDLREARDRAYAAADQIQFRGKQMRRDIGYRALDGAKTAR